LTGTHNAVDWITDGYLAAGKLKQTTRYKEADKMIKKPSNVSVTGHSLGFAVASGVLGLNGAYTIGQKNRVNKTHYHNNKDIVNLLGSGAKHTITLKNPTIQSGILPIEAYNAYNVNNIKDEKNICLNIRSLLLYS
jgi:hypothetical protein